MRLRRSRYTGRANFASARSASLGGTPDEGREMG